MARKTNPQDNNSLDSSSHDSSSQHTAGAGCPSITALLLAEHDLSDLDADQAGDPSSDPAHVTDCGDCRARASRLSFAMQPRRAPELTKVDADALFTSLVHRISREADLDKDGKSAGAGGAGVTTDGVPLAGVHLNCTYCKDHLSTIGAAYCASCLAPYHPECFSEHGRCAAPGCSELRVVQSRLPSELIKVSPATPKRPNRIIPGLAALAVGGLVAAAAFGPGNTDKSAAKGSSKAPVLAKSDNRFKPAGNPDRAPDPGGSTAANAEEFSDTEMPLEIRFYPVADLLVEEAPAVDDRHDRVWSLTQFLEADERARSAAPKWFEHYHNAITRRSVTLNFKDSTVSDVVGFLADITGLGFVIGPGVDSEARVSLKVRELGLESALKLILDRFDLSASVTRGTILFHKSRVAPPMRSVSELASVAFVEQEQHGAAVTRRVTAKQLLAELAKEIPVVEGERTMFHIDRGRLFLRQPAKVALAVFAELQRRRALRRGGIEAPDCAPALGSSWFFPAGATVQAPAQEAVRQTLDRATRQMIDLRMNGARFEQALDYFRSLSGLKVSVEGVDPATLPAVTLACPGIRLIDAMTLVAAQAGLVVDIHRDGVSLTPPGQDPLEVRLRRAASQALTATSRENRDAHRNLARTVTLDLRGLGLAEILDYLRSFQPNILLTRAAGEQLAKQGAERSSTLSVKSRPLSQVLTALLAEFKLTYELRDGVVCVIPVRTQQVLGGPISKADASVMLGRSVPLGLTADKLAVVDLAGFAKAVSQTTDATVVFPKGVGTAERLTLISGSALADMLALAARQLDLNFAVFRDHRGRPALALRVSRSGPALRALAQLAAVSDEELGDFPAVRNRRDALSEALEALAKVDSSEALSAALEDVAARRTELRAADMARRYAGQEGAWPDETKLAAITEKLKSIVQDLKDAHETRPDGDLAALKQYQLFVARHQSELWLLEERWRVLDESVRYTKSLINALAPVNAGEATWQETFPQGFKAWARSAGQDVREASKAAEKELRAGLKMSER